MTTSGDPRPNPSPYGNARMMVYEVELEDGSTAEIEAPEGTTQDQLFEAVRGYEAPSLESVTGGLIRDPAATPLRRSSGFENVLSGSLRGAEELGTGIAQLSAHATPGLMFSGVSDQVDAFARDRQAAYDRTAAGQSPGGEFGRLAGGMAAGSLLAPLAVPAKGASFLSSLARVSGGSALLGTVATPALSDNYWAEKAPQAATSAGLGALLLTGGRGFARASEEIANFPRRLVNFSNERANGTQFADEGEALAQRTGIPLTPGMVSGGRAQTFAENMARQSIFTADRAMDADIRVAQGALDYINRVGRRVSPTAAGVDTVGIEVQGAVRGAVKRAAERREEVANAQYGAIHAALGGRAVVDYTRTRAVLERIANPGGTLSGDALRAAEQARRLLGQIDGPRTLQQAIRDRSFWGSGTRGDGNVFNDISNPANRRFAAQLYGAIQDDISAAAARLDGINTGGPGIVPFVRDPLMRPGGNLGQALREADQNYRRYSDAINALEASPMARLLGDDVSVGDFLQFNRIPPERVIQKLGAMSPSELTMTRNFMEANAPEVWAQYKRLLIDNAAESATFLPTSAGARTVPLNAAQFVRALGGDKPANYNRLRSIFDESEMAEIDDALAAMRRMGDKFGFNFSGTDPRREARSLWDALRSGSGTAMASTAGEMSGLRAVSRVMMNADGRRATIELSRLPPNARRAPALAAYVAAIAAGQQMAYPEDESR
jgi:hypothetical protein